MGLKEIVLRLVGREPARPSLSREMEALILRAEDQARRYGSRSVDLHHLVLALLDERNRESQPSPQLIGADRGDLRERVIESLGKRGAGVDLDRPASGQRRLSRNALLKHVLQAALTESRGAGHDGLHPDVILRQIAVRRWPPADILRERGILPDS